MRQIHAHENMESLYKVIPMELWPTEYLPDDYKGPSAGSMASISGIYSLTPLWLVFQLSSVTVCHCWSDHFERIWSTIDWYSRIRS